MLLAAFAGTSAELRSEAEWVSRHAMRRAVLKPGYDDLTMGPFVAKRLSLMQE